MDISQDEGIRACRRRCWIVAALFGIAVMGILAALFGWHWLIALVLGLIVAGILGWLLPSYFCVSSGKPTHADPSAFAAAGSAAPADASDRAPAKPGDVAASADAAGQVTGEGQDGASGRDDAVTPSELAQAAEGAGDTEATTPSALAGDMRAGDDPVTPSEPAESVQTDDAAAATPSAQTGTVDAGASEAEPELYASAPGDADNLKEIKGVGPGLEKTLNGMGIYKFAQIAAWGASEIAWVDARLRFKGRIERDNWVDQAKTLASGGETEFSARVDKGDIY